jgi:hypothetical protein
MYAGPIRCVCLWVRSLGPFVNIYLLMVFRGSHAAALPQTRDTSWSHSFSALFESVDLREPATQRLATPLDEVLIRV